MAFTTLTFLLFLISVFALHWALRSRPARNATLVVASFIFYAFWDWRFACLMIASISVDYGVGRALEVTHDRGRRRLWLGLSLFSNLGLLGFFKYFGFFAENLQTFLAAIHWHVSPVTMQILLPVGISFYTFQSLSYTIDVYRRQLQPTRSWLDYATFVSFFPQLVAGPIERASSLLPQFQAPRVFDPGLARDGCRQILWGVFKKMVLADNLAVMVDAAYEDVPSANGVELAAATLFFAFQIYFDFSAYSDIAIGTAKLFGVQLMRNFAYPYFSRDPAEFWRRWHISLSTWFRDYVFIPLGGSRAGRARWIRNILITFAVSGLWHGASWNFVIWGLLNGLAVLLFLRTGPPRPGLAEVPGGPWDNPFREPRRWIGIFTTFLFICLTWIFFRSQTLSEALLILGRIPADALNPSAYRAFFQTMLGSLESWVILLHLGLVLGVEWRQRRERHALHLERWRRAARWVLYTLLVFDVLIYGTRNPGAFIYFQF
jgi:alginate O-acetyltransferase complex protein AlgI